MCCPPRSMVCASKRVDEREHGAARRVVITANDDGVAEPTLRHAPSTIQHSAPETRILRDPGTGVGRTGQLRPSLAERTSHVTKPVAIRWASDERATFVNTIDARCACG